MVQNKINPGSELDDNNISLPIGAKNGNRKEMCTRTKQNSTVKTTDYRNRVVARL